MNNLYLDTCSGKITERAPVWMMRQAGRYLPEYREIRKNYKFTEMVKNPDVVTEVTMQPVERLDVDAAILFSDILVIPEAFGMPLRFEEKLGPIFDEVFRSKNDLIRYKEYFEVGHLSYVFDSIKQIKKVLTPQKALIGFAGCPWTVATYMIEGGTTKKFRYCKAMCYEEPKLLHSLLNFLSDATIEYLKAQIEAGAQAIQLFDTWAGIHNEVGFEDYCLRYLIKIYQALKPYNLPFIYFPKGAGVWYEKLNQLPKEVIFGLDWTMSLATARKRFGNERILQGNMDPMVLYTQPQEIKNQVTKIIEQNGQNKKYIANLGHGILPDIPVDHAKAFIDGSKEASLKYYASF